jgi:transcriptional antiterminator NusG
MNNGEASEVGAKWYCWIIKSGKFNTIKDYLEREVPEVVSVYYPTIQRERSVYGKIKVRETPLFSGYMFLKYVPSDDVHHRIRMHAFVTTFVGICGADDIDKIEAIRAREDNKEFISKRQFNIGDPVLIVNGNFVSFRGAVEEVVGDRYYVGVNVFNRKMVINCSVDNIVSEEKDLFNL